MIGNDVIGSAIMPSDRQLCHGAGNYAMGQAIVLPLLGI